MTTLNIEKKVGYAIVQIDNGKVNAINELLAKDLATAFRALEADDEVKGVILAGRPHCFSAGLDIMSLTMGGPKGAVSFWTAYLDMLQVLVRFSKPMVCAITGYAPAGATIIICCADYRIMGRGEKHVVGMHEFKMSLQIPETLAHVYAYTMGEKSGWEAVLDAKLYQADEAVALGLVNEAVEVEEVLPLAEKKMQKYIKVYGPVFSRTKRYMRQGLLKAVDVDIPTKVEEFVETTKDPEFAKHVMAFMMSLKKKK